MLKEEFLQELLKELYEKETLQLYDYTANKYSTHDEVFLNTKTWTDHLVKEKLAKFSDTDHTLIHITNFGRYWMLNGGYASFLQDGHNTKEIHKDKNDPKSISIQKEKEDLLEARLKLTHYRLTGFWLTIVISTIGFFLSIFNLYVLFYGRR
jgi:hypothetical protein